MSGSEATVMANPIRKVVTMLQTMQKTVEEEGEEEKNYTTNSCATVRVAEKIWRRVLVVQKIRFPPSLLRLKQPKKNWHR